MAVAVVPVLTRERPRSGCWTGWRMLPQLVLAPSFAATLFFVYGFILWTTYLSFTKSRIMPIYSLDGARPMSGLWANPRSGGLALDEPRDLRRALYRHRLAPRPAARDPARPEDPRRGRAAADLPLPDGALLHRHRHGLEVVPRSRHRPREDGARLGLDELQVRLDHQHATWRSTASSSPASGSPRASSWRCSWPACAASTARSSRRRRSTARRPARALPADHHPAAAAGVPVAPSSCSRTWRSSPTTSSWR